MPSIASFFRRSRKAPEGHSDPPYGPDKDGPTVETEASIKLERRLSRRDFFRTLLSRPGTRSGPRDGSRNSLVQTTPSDTPRPILNSNKPLPPPPPPGTEEPTKRSEPRKMNRIMVPLTIDDIHNLFSGAPQFFCRSEGISHGAPWPSVAFPWNEEPEIKNLGDHKQIDDEAWSSVTAAQYITRDERKNHLVTKEFMRKRQAHFNPQCFERPNMISNQGIDPGTVGYSAALQIGVADALMEEEDKTDLEPLVERRHNFLSDKRNGLRILDELDIITRLAELGELYTEDTVMHAKSNIDLYQELFTRALWPPTRVTDSQDPYSLRVQIESLVSVLTVDNIWYDFSLVEWRIRLGQLLWGMSDDEDTEDGGPTGGGYLEEPGWQRFWLLLQILLSSELLIRLDIATKSPVRNSNSSAAADLEEFAQDATIGLRWSLILARRWLDNIKVIPPKMPTRANEKHRPGWLETLTGSGAAKAESSSDDFRPAGYTGRHQLRQLQGLVRFARSIDWPRVDIIAAKVSQNMLNGEGQASTPTVSTPLSMTSQGSSYFADGVRPGLRRGISKQSRIQATLQSSGWLSRSYLNGLVLPGEALGHFLISTLLENDTTAVSQIGEEANLYGGFVYSQKSFWSSSCVIGKVLAAGKNAKECMGWLSTDIVPKGVRDGWVNVDVDVAPQHVDNTPSTSRIWNKAAIERESHVLGTSYNDSTSLLPGDFEIPPPDPLLSMMTVSFLGLDLFATDSDALSNHAGRSDGPRPATSSTEPELLINTYISSMRFHVSGLESGFAARTERELDLELKYDVHFVAAHPCVPSTNVKILQAPSSPLFREHPRSDTGCGENPHDLFPGHALHKSFNYTRLNLRDILIPPTIAGNKGRTRPDPLASLHTSSDEVFIIDCAESLRTLTPRPPTVRSTISRPVTPQPPSRTVTPTLPNPSSNLPSGSFPVYTAAATFSPSGDTSPVVSSGFRPNDSGLSGSSFPRPSTSRSYAPAPLSGLTILQPSFLPVNAPFAQPDLLRPSTAPSQSKSLKPISSNASLASSAKSDAKGLSLEMLMGLDKQNRGSDLEMLTRAWCAEKGFNALISRQGRNCVACSVREARALGWKVVLRFR